MELLFDEPGHKLDYRVKYNDDQLDDYSINQLEYPINLVVK